MRKLKLDWWLVHNIYLHRPAKSRNKQQHMHELCTFIWVYFKQDVLGRSESEQHEKCDDPEKCEEKLRESEEFRMERKRKVCTSTHNRPEEVQT